MNNKGFGVKIFAYFAKYGVLALLGILVICLIITGIIFNKPENIINAVVIFCFIIVVIAVSMTIGIFKNW